MTTTAEVRPIRPDVTSPARLTPFIAGIHSTAAFITAHNLSAASIAFFEYGILVDLAGLPHPKGDLTRWAAHLDAPCAVVKPLIISGRMHMDHEVSGISPNGTFIRVVARELVTEARR